MRFQRTIVDVGGLFLQLDARPLGVLVPAEWNASGRLDWCGQNALRLHSVQPSHRSCRAAPIRQLPLRLHSIQPSHRSCWAAPIRLLSLRLHSIQPSHRSCRAAPTRLLSLSLHSIQPSHRSAGLHQYVCFHCVSIRYNLHIGIARHCARTVEHAATRAGGGALPRAIADVGGLFLQFGARLLGVPSSCPDGRTPPPGRAAVRFQRRVLMSGDHFFMILPKRPTVHDASKTGD